MTTHFDPLPPFLTLAELSLRWRTTRSSLARAIRAGTIPTAKPTGGKVLVAAAVVAEAERSTATN